MKKNYLKTFATIVVMFFGLAVIFVYENISKLWRFEKESKQPASQSHAHAPLETSTQNVF